MKKTKPIVGWASLLAFFAVTAFFLSANPGGVAGAGSQSNGRADIIVIDDLAGFGSLEFPGVTFKHDLHTGALADQGKDCAACHLEKTAQNQDSAWNYKFGRVQDDSHDAVKDIYHNGCISCHAAEVEAGRPAGPQAAECRSCHAAKADAAQERLDISLDKYLHARHIEAENITRADSTDEDNCSACHHVFDPQNADRRRAWKKQAEDSCRACHLAAPSPNPEDRGRAIPALENAAHDTCISCHLNQAKSHGADKSGPYDCAGCHSAGAQAELVKKRPAEVGRLNRGQPDKAMLLPVSAKIAPGDMKGSMSPVPFDHKIHESSLDSCRVCHHEGRIAACSTCHSLEGGAGGNFVNLSEAMHKAQSDRSCAGCHSLYAQDPSCAGCHASMPKTQSPQSCASCHTVHVGVSETQAADGSLLQMDKGILNRLAAASIRASNAGKSVLNMEDVPERVAINILAAEYQAVDLPHRKIVRSLTDGMFENKLAQSFHKDVTTMCQGCHHNSAASLTPPKCASCHTAGAASGFYPSRPWGSAGAQPPVAPDGRPRLKVAYHNQCMGCHSAMNIEKPSNTDCAGCHAPAKKAQG